MKVTYYGHSCFLAEIGDFRVLFGPFITPNPLATNIDVDQIAADFILLPPGHRDHIFDVERMARRTGATVVKVFRAGMYLLWQGLRNGVLLKLSDRLRLSFGTSWLVSAAHSNQFPDESYSLDHATAPELAGRAGLTLSLSIGGNRFTC